MTEVSDAQVIAQVLAGDTDAYSVLVRRYQNAYFRFAVRMLGNRDDADDALQHAFIRAYRALPQCRDPERFAAWLYRIVVNECRTFATRRDDREQRFVRGDAMDWSQAGRQEQEMPVDLDEIHRALRSVDHEQREAFILKYVEDLSYEEMADLTGAGVSALKMRVKRACDRLRKLLDASRSAT